LEVDVRANLERMKIQGWSKMATVREAWKRSLEQVKTHIKRWSAKRIKRCSVKRGIYRHVQGVLLLENIYSVVIKLCQL
jgi:hypothetical protein